MDSFAFRMADDALDDLRARLRAARFPAPSAGPWEAGSDPRYLRDLVAYWADQFDWRAAEARLAAYPQFRHDGIHFVHIRRDASRPPVLLTHGWPSSYLELLPLADRLDVDVVIPSLPGFLHSDLSSGPLSRAVIAESFHSVMRACGYDRYFAFGGDIGGACCGWLATMYPVEVAGVHLIHGPFPAAFDEPLTPDEKAFLDGDEEYDERDGGYSAIMGTRPDTVAAALLDSPAGLAAWIVDKLHAWCDGDFEAAFDRDTLCTMLTLYWATGSIGTSFRQYFDWTANGPRPRIDVPVAVTQSNEEGMRTFPLSIAQRAASDIRQYSVAQRGGHFLALENPDLIASDLTRFMTAVS